MNDELLAVTQEDREAAAKEIGRLATRIVTELAPIAGLYVGIKIEPTTTGSPQSERTKVATCEFGFWKNDTKGCPVCGPDGPCHRLDTRPTPAAVGGDVAVRAALVRVATALNIFIECLGGTVVKGPGDHTTHYRWMRDATFEEGQEAMEANNAARAALDQGGGR